MYLMTISLPLRIPTLAIHLLIVVDHERMRISSGLQVHQVGLGVVAKSRDEIAFAGRLCWIWASNHDVLEAFDKSLLTVLIMTTNDMNNDRQAAARAGAEPDPLRCVSTHLLRPLRDPSYPQRLLVPARTEPLSR
jgi:hypothetical protein